MIEDEMFTKALEIKGIKRTKSMYKKSIFPHCCNMCLDKNEDALLGYALKIKYVTDWDTPYLFICDDCYNSLPEE